MLKKLALAGALLAALMAVPVMAACPYLATGIDDVANAQLKALNDICSGAGAGSYTGPAAAQLPASLGSKTSANSLSVVRASDDTLPAGTNIIGRVGIDQATPGTTNLVSIGTNGSVTPLASENHIGEVGNNQTTVTVAQTVTAASAYASGNAVGGLIAFASSSRVAAGSGLVQSAAINSKSAQTTQMDLVMFNANPTGTTCTDKTAIAVAAADFDKVLGVAHVVDWTALGTPSIGQAQNLAMPFALASGTTLYGCLVTRATPTFTAATDISVSLRVIRN